MYLSFSSYMKAIENNMILLMKNDSLGTSTAPKPPTPPRSVLCNRERKWMNTVLAAWVPRLFGLSYFPLTIEKKRKYVYARAHSKCSHGHAYWLEPFRLKGRGCFTKRRPALVHRKKKHSPLAHLPQPLWLRSRPELLAVSPNVIAFRQYP